MPLRFRYRTNHFTHDTGVVIVRQNIWDNDWLARAQHLSNWSELLQGDRLSWRGSIYAGVTPGVYELYLAPLADSDGGALVPGNQPNLLEDSVHQRLQVQSGSHVLG